MITKRDFVTGALQAMQVPPERHPFDEQLAPEKTYARVDWGRWLSDCPYCTGASLVDFSQPLMYCLNCHNERGGHRYVEVILPSDEERAAIEAALDDLQESEQHWRPEHMRPPAPVDALTNDERLIEIRAEATELRAQVAALRQAYEQERFGALALIGHIEYQRHVIAAEQASRVENPHEHQHGALGHEHN